MRNLRLFLRYARLNLMSAAEYRASFLGAALGMLLNNSTFVFFWWVAFGYAGESIGGYSFDDVMFIWAASSTAYGLAHVFFDGAVFRARLCKANWISFCSSPSRPF